MPQEQTFNVQDAQGRPLSLTGDHQPSPADIQEASEMKYGKAEAPQPSIMDRIKGAGEGLMQGVQTGLGSMGVPVAPPPKFSQEQRNKNARVVAQALPVIGGIAAIPLTGGASVPAAMGISGAIGGVTGAASAAAQGKSGGDIATEGLENAAINALTEGGAQYLKGAAPALKNTAVNWWQKLAKAGVEDARAANIAREGGTLPEASREIAQTVLESGHGPLTPTHTIAMKQGIKDLNDQLNQVVANNWSQTFPRKNIEDALQQEMRNVGVGTVPQEARQGALRNAMDALQKLPDDVPVPQAQQMKDMIYNAAYGPGLGESAASAAGKAEGSALRGNIEQVVPRVIPLNAKMSELIPASEVHEAATFRAGKRDPINATKLIAAAVRNPLTIGAALINDPTMGSYAAQQLFNRAPQIAGAAPAVNATVRSALLTLMGAQ